jgi:hypothetical protein
VTQPGQPYQPPDLPQQWQNPTPPPTQGYPEPDGNYLGLQQTPPTNAYPQQVATGRLRVHLQGSVLTSSMITPTLLINGSPVTASYGPNDYILPSGAYRVSAYAQWLRQYGQASLDVPLSPGQTTEIYYAAPLHQFSAGSMGFVRQSREGGGVVLLAIIFAVLVMLMALGLVLFTVPVS